MEEKKTTVTKQETIAALKKPGELYVVMSGATKMPFVWCDEDTFDDEVLLYYQLKDARAKAKELLEQKYLTAVAKVEEKDLLKFYTSLYTMGVNCLSVNSGTDIQTSLQLEELVVRKKPEQLPQGQKIVENPALHLTALYFMQEMRRQAGQQPSEQLKEMQEELIAHYQKSTLLVAVEEDGKIPLLKQKDGTIYQPVYTDPSEVQKFIKGKKMKVAAIPALKIPGMLAQEAKGVVINPYGVNVQLQVARPKKNPAPVA